MRRSEVRYVFFGLRADIEVAHYLTELIDSAVRTELGRYKTSAEYRQFRHQERHMANASFALGMVASIADKLMAMKAERDQVKNSTGRGLVVLKAAVVDTELEQARPEAPTRSTAPAAWCRPTPTTPARPPVHRCPSIPRSGGR